MLDLIHWCLKLDPLERPQSVFQVQKVLLEDMAEAAPAPFAERFKRMVGFMDKRKEAPDTQTPNETDLPTDWR
jgi:hypothetical protein